MDKIKSYIDRFFSKTKKNKEYAMKSDEFFVFMDEIVNAKDADGAFNTICTLFNFGYVKGYRAARAQMKKGGAA